MNSNITKQTKIGVLLGGLSSEKGISMLTGEAVFKSLTRLGYNAVKVEVDRTLPFKLKDMNIEVVFNALHGTYGEDGTIQGLLELMGIPYTGSGITASAIAMDKILTKHLMTSAGILTPQYITLNKPVEYSELLKESGMNLPYMIKPAREGSSIGISKVSTPQELPEALSNAFKYGNRVLVEKFIEGKDITVAIYDNKVLGSMEINVADNSAKSFLDYEAKYTEGMEVFCIPPSIQTSLIKTIEDIALSAHQLLGCSFYSRIDFKVASAGRAYLLEVNTLPGLTALSYVPKIAESKGINYDQLIEGILKSASLKEGKGL
ncbi:MAG: D-alanine--D-alanine ligase [bacterium]